MAFLYFLEKMRHPLLDEAMLLITRLGEETAFLVAALIVFWCVDKRKGYYVMSIGFVGTMVNQFLKLVCAVPRPWVIDPKFTIVEAAREAAAGYSFPSGHSQNAVGTFAALAVISKYSWLKGLWITIAVLVPFSRMYFGVHTPMDVLTASAFALLLVRILYPMTKKNENGRIKNIIRVMLVMAAFLLGYFHCFPFPEDIDIHNLESGMKNAYTMAGCMVGIAVAYPAERKFVNFETKAVWWAQIGKVIFGLGCVLLVKEGLRAPLELVLGIYPARAVRYFLIVVTAGLLVPMSFRWFSKLGVKHELRNH